MTATAPYNFVPQPRQVYTPTYLDDAPWEAFDTWLPGHHHGWIDLSIHTLTPLFTRGPVTQTPDGDWDQRDARLRPDPYMVDGRPAIPGSTIRGLLRTLVEILSFAKVQPVNAAPMYYRSAPRAGRDRVPDEYRRRVAGRDIETGFLVRDGRAWRIQPCRAARVSHALLTSQFAEPPFSFEYRSEPEYRPNVALQGLPVQVEVNGEEVTAIEGLDSGTAPPTGRRKATLLLTGAGPGKEHEWVFYEAGVRPNPVDIPEDQIRKFHHDAQLTNYQKTVFPRSDPHRRSDGGMRSGEPVFFTRSDEETVDFFGRAQLFRYPYDTNLPAAVSGRSAGTDLAEAVFGRISDEPGSPTIKSRVHVGDARQQPDTSEVTLHDLIVPQLLMSPRATALAHYLEQPSADPYDQRGYFAGERIAARGHKLYWHRWDAHAGIHQIKEPDGDPQNLTDTQTSIRAVPANTSFTCRIHFSNLTGLELGALMSALDAPHGCAHKLGMGKPLGLGSVRLRPALTLIDPQRRYRSWRSTGLVAADTATQVAAHSQARFAKAMTEHARETGEPQLEHPAVPHPQHLTHTARLDALFVMMHWDARPPRQRTQYMGVDDASRPNYKDKHRLPYPHAVFAPSAPQPDWSPQVGQPVRAEDPRRSDAHPARWRIEAGIRVDATVQRLGKKAKWLLLLDPSGERVEGQLAAEAAPHDLDVGYSLVVRVTEEIVSGVWKVEWSPD